MSTFNWFLPPTYSLSQPQVFEAGVGTSVALTVKGASGQSVDIFRVQDSAGTNVLRLDNSGNLTIAGTSNVALNEAVTGNISLTGTLSVTGTSTLTGAVTMASTLGVTGTTTLNTTSTGALTVRNGLTVLGDVSFSGTLLLASGATFSAGTAAAPSITFTGDTDTGLYNSSANVLGFTAAGTSLATWAAGLLSINAGAVSWSAGVAVTAASYSVSRDADATNQLHFNVPTGATMEWSVNDVAKLGLNATALKPGANDGTALGDSSTTFSDLFLALGAVINFNSDVTITHSADTLAFAGATIYTWDAPVRWGTGVAVTAAQYEIGRDADGTNQLHFNVPTGATMEWSVNDVAQLTLSVTTLGLATNTITGIGSDITGTANTALTISTPNSSGTAAGTDVTVKAGAASTSGAGGNIFLWPGAAAGAAAPGTVQIYSASAGSAVVNLTSSGAGIFSIQPSGGISNVEFSLSSAGSTFVSFNVSTVTSAVNYLQAAGAVAASHPILSALGSDTNINVTITPKGSGKTNFTAGNLDIATSANILVNAANPKKTLVLSAGGGIPTETAGCASTSHVGNESTTNKINYSTLDFDTTTSENAFWTTPMPDGYDGSTFTAQFTWTNASGLATETVDWGIKMRMFADDDAIDQAWGTEVTTTDTFLAQRDLHKSATSTAITPAGTLAGSNWLAINVARKTASDNLTGDAKLIAVKLEYGVATFSD